MAKLKLTNEQKGMLGRAKANPIILTLTPQGEEFSHADGSPAHARTVTSLIKSGMPEGRGDNLLPGRPQSYQPSLLALKRIT